MTLAELLAAYREGALDPGEVVGRAHARALAQGSPAWISVVREPQLRSGPLHGVPFAVKDNIDVAGIPTTAGCPAFARTPERSAAVVERLEAAGAVMIGKTNLDQFATGLTGTRSPFGACASVADPRYVSGGSSSGSAVVVADGTVPFALGTDTAGSGRVPAAFNGIVGCKPTRGLVSVRGVVPACRSLDCVSVFTRTVADAELVVDVMAGYDAADPFSRVLDDLPGGGTTIGVPDRFIGDAESERAWDAALVRAQGLGWTLRPFDPAPFFEAAALLYEGPWVAERYLAVGAFVDAHPQSVEPTVRAVIAGGRARAAVELFAAQHRLAELRREVAGVLAGVDALLFPTTPTHPTLAEVAAAPIERNTELGTYTNFVNLLDLCALAVPAAPRADGLPFGVTLMAPAGGDRRLLGLGGRWASADALELALG